MEDVLVRLWELSQHDTLGSRPDPALLTEAQHLWKTLETLTATQKATELSVHEATFSKLLECIHRVLKTPGLWTASAHSAAGAATSKSTFEFTLRVLVKIACRGEDERGAIMQEGLATLLVQSVLVSDAPRLTSGEIVALLHVLQTLAFDTQQRIDLLKCDAIQAALDTMQNLPNELGVQVCGCKFLQFMAYEESAKERIIHHHGIEVVLDALGSFASDVQLATSASDLLYFLSLDLENALASHKSDLTAMTEAIMDHVIRLMRTHSQLQPVQVHGTAVLLTFAGSQASSRLYLSQHGASSSLWDVVTVTVFASDDAAADTIDLLQLILETDECYEALQTSVMIGSTPRDASAQMCTLHCMSTLISCLESKRNRSQYADKARSIAFVIDRIQSLVESTKSPPSPSPVKRVTETDEEEVRLPIRPHHATPRQLFHTYDDNDGGESEDAHRFLGEVSPTKTEGDSSYGCFDEFVDDHEDSHDDADKAEAGERVTSSRDNLTQIPHRTGHTNDDVPPPRNWQRECALARRAHRELDCEYRLLQENYQILLRRAQEQSKLLNIQNARIRHHADVHQRVLERVRTLETALVDAQRKHHVERELRLAEVAQSEKIALSLHEAMKEISALSKHNSTATRELRENEKFRVDYQQKVSAVRQQQQKLEYERDDAVVQMLSMRQEQLALSKRLDESRREADEALQMREEDVDAPKLSAFSELLSRSPSTARLRRVSSYTLTTKRVTAEVSDRQHRKSMYAGSIQKSISVRPVDTATIRTASLYDADRSNRSSNLMAVDGELQREDEESTMEPPKDDATSPTGFGSYAFPQRGLDKMEIERTLRRVYEGLEKCAEGGVHLATIRRFFVDCGVVQPPLVTGDVDTILTRVLNQAQENRRRVMVRKDFTVSTIPGGIGSSSLQKKATEAKRFRFFDEEAFFEAVTLLVMRRFPRFEAKKALEVFITESLHPMQRQQQQTQWIQQRRSSVGNSTMGTAPTRSGSLGTSGGSTSPTAACVGILKALLNSLALHVGHDAEPPDSTTVTLTPVASSLLRHATPRKPQREDVVYAMLEMHAVLAREYKPLATICEFYSALHLHHHALLKDDSMPLPYELLLAFAMDFEIIPSFMDRLSLKHLHAEVSGYLKTSLALQKKAMSPSAVDSEMLKKVTFSMLVARLAMELFSAKREYETPEKQITALLQWLDNSAGRDKIQKKAMLPVVIKFSRKLYAIRP